jgi:hypothetical protein
MPTHPMLRTRSASRPKRARTIASSDREKSAGTRTPGRPAKFDEPSRPVTLTLPVRTLEQLGTIQRDRARAVVQATDAFVGGEGPRPAPVEVVPVGSDAAIILVSACPALASIPCLRAIEVSHDRYLLTIVPGTALETLEVQIADLIDDLATTPSEDRLLLVRLREVLRNGRRVGGLRKAEILFVDPPMDRKARASRE